MNALRHFSIAIPLLVLAACASETTPRTEIVIVVDSDLLAPEEIDRVNVSVVREGGTTMDSESGPVIVDGRRALPLTVTLLHSGGPLGPLRVTAEAIHGDTIVVSQLAQVSFVKDKRKMLRMNLVRACLPTTITCPTDRTCIDGACSAIGRDNELTDWQPDAGMLETTDAATRDAGGDASVDAAVDASADAAVDASHDATTDDDAGDDPDAGPTCISTPEQCNELDDDCDTRIDEGFPLDTLDNCGVCGNSCPTNLVNARSECNGGQCELICANQTFNCDGDNEPSDTPGCETNLTSPSNCGACGVVCDAVDGTPFCGVVDGTLECVGACGALTQCVVGSGASCVDTETDPLHCGGCDPCAPQANTSPSCADGTCDYTCFSGYASCIDDNDDNGCETNTRTDPAHCSACGNACDDRDNSSPRCVNGACDIACDNGFTDCDGMISSGCEIATNSDPDNCGSCDNECPTRAFGTRVCAGGSCGVACNAGRGNCDGNLANGCETNLSNNKSHCGGCGIACTGLNLTCCRGSCAALCL